MVVRFFFCKWAHSTLKSSFLTIFLENLHIIVSIHCVKNCILDVLLIVSQKIFRNILKKNSSNGTIDFHSILRYEIIWVLELSQRLSCFRKIDRRSSNGLKTPKKCLSQRKQRSLFQIFPEEIP